MGKKAMSKYWWAMIMRGILAILFAMLALFWTHFTLELLVLVFGAFVLVEGIISVFGSIGAAEEHKQWWTYLLRGLLGILIGLLILFWPGITVIVFVYLVAIWAVLMGIMEIWVGSKLLEEVSGKWALTTIGVISIIVGIIIMIMPYASLTIITWLVGIFALISGIGLIIFGLQIKNPS